MGRGPESDALRAIDEEIACERAESARLRAEIATVSLSLEAGKDKLEHLLLASEARHAGAAGADASSADRALARSLQLQIQATRDGVEKLRAQENELAAETARLSALLLASQDEATGAQAGPDRAAVVAASERAVESLRKAAAVADSSGPGSGKSSSALSSPQPGRDAGMSWREHSLPNLSLLRSTAGSGAERSISSGLVMDRVFDGIVAFTSGQSRMGGGPGSPLPALSGSGKMKDDVEVTSCVGPISRPVHPSLLADVGAEYSSLCITDGGGVQRVDLVALTPSLERARQLIDMHALKSPAACVDPKSDRGQRLASAGAPPELSEESSATHATSVNAHMAGKFPAAVEPPPKFSHASKVLSFKQFAQLLNAAPRRFRDSDLQRLYCSDADGIALSTMLKKAMNESPVLLVLRDTGNNVFGCYAPVPWKDSSSRSYGTGECWVFRGTAQGDSEVFHWSRKNNFFQVSSHEHIAIGGGGHFALWIDEDLMYGSTAPCSTFNSPALCPAGRDHTQSSHRPAGEGQIDFQIVVVELWKLAPPGHLVS